MGLFGALPPALLATVAGTALMGSLAGAMGTFYVFYDLSKRFTLRGESGAQSAVDLIFTTRYD